MLVSLGLQKAGVEDEMSLILKSTKRGNEDDPAMASQRRASVYIIA